MHGNIDYGVLYGAMAVLAIAGAVVGFVGGKVTRKAGWRFGAGLLATIGVLGAVAALVVLAARSNWGDALILVQAGSMFALIPLVLAYYTARGWWKSRE